MMHKQLTVSNSSSFIITAGPVDTVPPVITNCPGATIMVTAPAGSNGAVATWTPITATDNDGMSPRLTQSHRSGDFFQVGDTIVSYTFTDQSGNSAFCSFTVNVRIGKYTRNLPSLLVVGNLSTTADQKRVVFFVTGHIHNSSKGTNNIHQY